MAKISQERLKQLESRGARVAVSTEKKPVDLQQSTLDKVEQLGSAIYALIKSNMERQNSVAPTPVVQVVVPSVKKLIIATPVGRDAEGFPQRWEITVDPETP